LRILSLDHDGARWLLTLSHISHVLSLSCSQVLIPHAANEPQSSSEAWVVSVTGSLGWLGSLLRHMKVATWNGVTHRRAEASAAQRARSSAGGAGGGAGAGAGFGDLDIPSDEPTARDRTTSFSPPTSFSSPSAPLLTLAPFRSPFLCSPPSASSSHARPLPSPSYARPLLLPLPLAHACTFPHRKLPSALSQHLLARSPKTQAPPVQTCVCPCPCVCVCARDLEQPAIQRPGARPIPVVAQ
jgi:hypothetical protein